MTTSVQLSIIIVNYNGLKYLSSCIGSIVKHIKTNYEIIIVDNASTDNSVQFLKENYQNDIIIIESKINLGFSKGNNLGASHAKGNTILLLNNDTILLTDLDKAIKKLNQKQIGAIGIKMLGKVNEYRLSAGYFPSPLRLLKLKSLYKTNQGFYKGVFLQEFYDVDWIEASFLLIKKEVWNSIKGFDEDYFMYVEDIDLCKRILNNNYKVIYMTSLAYIHYGGYGESREQLLKEGLIKYAKKHFNYLARPLALLSITLNFKVKKIKRFSIKL